MTKWVLQKRKKIW